MNPWQSYEQTVAYIYQELGKQNNVKVICYGNNCKVSSLSYIDKPVDHQIDVLTEFFDGLHTHRTAIECKYWNKKVTKDTVMKLKSIVDDCNITKGVIVSKMGFTPDAKETAKKYKVELVILRDFLETDFPRDRLAKIDINLTIIKPTFNIKKISLDLKEQKDKDTLKQILVKYTNVPLPFSIQYPDLRKIDITELISSTISAIDFSDKKKRL